jgi:Na+/phosphate symporter
VMPLLATSRMHRNGRRVAMANLGFNVFGVALFVPFLEPFSRLMLESVGDPGIAVAWAQLVFNAAMSVAVLFVLRFLGPQINAVADL